MTNQKEKFVKVPVEWLEGLQERAKKISTIEDMDVLLSTVNGLLGYIESANLLLSPNLKEDEES